MATKRLTLVKGGALGQAAVDKLASSGLTEEHGARLGMYEVQSAATLESWFESHPALVIPYYGTNGAPLAQHPTHPPFYRARYLSKDFSFKNAAGEKVKRYIQPANSGICAYFPPVLDWKFIESDATEPLLITEGELKAAKACLEGFPTVGLGGVSNFRSASKGVFLLPELEAFTWARRRVTIVYDSDYHENAGICHAINTLAEELCERGAFVFVANLPDVYSDDKKTGLDDFLVERSDEDLVKVLKEAEPITMARKLWEMNDELVYVSNPGLVIARASQQMLPVPVFTGHSNWATLSVPERKVNLKTGQISVEKVEAAHAWIRWPLRTAVSKLTYMPGKDVFYQEKDLTYYNKWKGWGVEPKKGDVKPWLDLIKFLFTGAEPEAVEWFLDWCAYPLQFPGTKLFSACLIHGRMTGTGKTLVFYTLKKIYGENFAKIKNEDLQKTWWLEDKQFVLGDEISGSDKRSESDALKTLITQEESNIDIKYVPNFTIPDCINYGFTSNHPDAFFMEDEDRRLFIHEVVQEKPLPREFYREYDKWKDGPGAAALFHWLLQRDLKKFDPKAEAFKTAARQRMVVHGKSDLDSWCMDLKINPAQVLVFGQLRHQRDMFTSKELLDIYLAHFPGASGKLTANGMGRALAKAGFRQAYAGAPIMVGEKQARYVIVRNYDKWSKVKEAKLLVKNIVLQPVKGQ